MLWDSHECRISVAQWSGHQILTAKAPVWAPGGQSIYTKIPIILWISSVCDVWVGLGVMSVMSMHLEGIIIVCNKVVVAASSHYGSPGSITWKSWMQAAKQIPIGWYTTVSQRVKLINWILWTLGKRAVGADAEYALVSIGGLRVCYVLASGWW